MEPQRKDRERQEEEEGTKEPKIQDIEKYKAICFIWGGMLVFEAHDPTQEWYTIVAAAIHNPI